MLQNAEQTVGIQNADINVIDFHWKGTSILHSIKCPIREEQRHLKWYACAAFPGCNVKMPPHWKRDRFSEREFFGTKF